MSRFLFKLVNSLAEPEGSIAKKFLFPFLLANSGSYSVRSCLRINLPRFNAKGARWRGPRGVLAPFPLSPDLGLVGVVSPPPAPRGSEARPDTESDKRNQKWSWTQQHLPGALLLRGWVAPLPYSDDTPSTIRPTPIAITAITLHRYASTALATHAASHSARHSDGSGSGPNSLGPPPPPVDTRTCQVAPTRRGSVHCRQQPPVRLTEHRKGSG